MALFDSGHRMPKNCQELDLILPILNKKNS